MSGKLTIRKKSGMYVFPLEDVIYMEKDLRKIRVHTQLEDFPCVEFYSRFEDLYESLDERFMRCHRSYLINMDKIVVMSDSNIYMEGEHSVYMGRETFKKAKDELNRYLEKKVK